MINDYFANIRFHYFLFSTKSNSVTKRLLKKALIFNELKPVANDFTDRDRNAGTERYVIG